MRPAILLLAVALPAGAATAQTRPFSPALPCAEVGRLVSSRGAVVVSTSATTYDRLVRDRGFCEVNELTETTFIPAADTRQCFAGYTCKPRSPFNAR